MTPPILASAADLLQAYDVLFCDVWGVVHNGERAYAEAGEALARFRAGGGTVILVSNAPVPAGGVEQVLDKTGARRDAWDAIVSSGDIALRHIAEKGYSRLHRVGPPARDRSLFSRLPGPHTPLEEADAIVCTGLRNSLEETVETYRDLIEAGVARKMPFVCANPDLVVDVGETRHLCAGSIAAEYEQLRRRGILGRQAASLGLRHGPAGCRRVARSQTPARPRAGHRRCRAHRPRRRQRAWASTDCSSRRASTTIPP